MMDGQESPEQVAEVLHYLVYSVYFENKATMSITG